MHGWGRVLVRRGWSRGRCIWGWACSDGRATPRQTGRPSWPWSWTRTHTIPPNWTSPLSTNTNSIHILYTPQQSYPRTLYTVALPMHMKLSKRSYLHVRMMMISRECSGGVGGGRVGIRFVSGGGTILIWMGRGWWVRRCCFWRRRRWMSASFLIEMMIRVY